MSNARTLAQAGAMNQTGRNRIHNPDMAVNQGSLKGGFATDRWTNALTANVGLGPVYSWLLDGPTWRLPNSIKYGNTTATTGTLNDFCARQYLELNDIKDFQGQKVTLSFWYKSNRAGTHGARVIGTMASGQAGGADIAKPFTVNAANTWEWKSITYDSFLNLTSWGNGAFTQCAAVVDIGWCSTGVGQTSMAANDSFQVTGVQLEIGPIATPFEQRSYAHNLQQCQRFFELIPISWLGWADVAGRYIGGVLPMKVTKRVAPTMSGFMAGPNPIYNTIDPVSGMSAVDNNHIRLYLKSTAGGSVEIANYYATAYADFY